jgi:arginase
MGKNKINKGQIRYGAGTRGLDLGIDAIEIAINQNSDYFNRFMFEDVKTHNENHI